MNPRLLRRPALVALPLSAALALTVVVGTAEAEPSRHGSAARVVSTATLPDIPLARFSNGLIPGSVDDDRNVDLGGIGSDLYPAERHGEYWTVTDRGPNGQIAIGKDKRRTFPVPGFDPAIVKVRAEGGRLRVLQSIPLTTRSGAPVTGLPNQPGRDEAPYTYDASTPLPYNPNGLDTEGVVRDRDGSFWLVDEYGPSLVHVSAKGRVLARHVPKGLGLTGTDYPVIESFPSVFLKRKINRGFEGLALLPDGDLVMALQSPLLNPDKATGEESRNTRLVRFSPRKNRVTAEYAYRFDPVGTVEPGQTKTSELKISSVVALGGDRLLVQERTDKSARVHEVRLRPSSDILGTPWDTTAAPALEQLDGKAADKGPFLPKRLVVDLNTVPGVPGKIEGIAVEGSSTLVLINDNDFGMTDGPEAFDANGRLVDSGIETTLVKVRLGRPVR
ncbi:MULTISPECIES: esterase-like activity of phytase family protein [unclassified Streptomyces]|uniref:esterase-like activity of phytase family protein n=1 Tax=unclassified Streptomyces TaxID=2593676 RepID=UPI00166134D2|nr:MULTISPECIES: esterase-like activity of phytase family protein [unclassified Streptomyces]MBD0710270.1 Tat pathway signal protein [Streptomyces sp. CBMA291]MBD0712863.1 Tat pathway signal protein [Streptomyces sp. CBMA370]